MIEKLLMLSLGFLWHILKGELPISVVGATLVLGSLFAVFGEWSHRRPQRLKMEGEQVSDREVRNVIGEVLITVASTFIVAGFVYGAFQIGAKSFPAWGWPILTSIQLAWLSLIVVGCALVGMIILELLRKKDLNPDVFWITFTLVWAMLSACVVEWVYPLPGKMIGIDIAAGIISAAICLFFTYLQQQEFGVETTEDEGGAISVNN
ncbi:hypothetical protein [Paenibacillus azoreducens]|uniref:Uncharacterized protein n=1 Tax=Paenibacillus azoreducens TaxID=116718 RepID=A0A920CV54_9BACL|nr:hypothetical protein [Paenibacillus azoreducens]GIO51054.1 hypothetical protein J34TS1_58190 [Paenibacillus azoreducens]